MGLHKIEMLLSRKAIRNIEERADWIKEYFFQVLTP